VHVGVNLAFLAPREMGGLEVYSRELVAALAGRSDIRMTLFVNRLLAREPRWRELGDVTVLELDPRHRVEWVRADQLILPRAAKRAGVDVVHSLASTGPSLGSFRRVVTVHDLNYLIVPSAHFGLRALGMRILVPLAVRASHRVIVPSESTRRDLVGRLGTPARKIDVVAEGVGQVSSHAAEPTPDAVSDQRPLVLSVSAKRPHKNLRVLIGALARIPSERRPLLVLPGYPTPHEAELRDHARALGLENDVRFLGWVTATELKDLYASAACFVFPSLYEGFGLPVLEAMAHGVPVATSARASLGEVAGDAALLFDPEDEASIAAAVERILGDREFSGRLRAAGLARAARFSWEAAAEGTVASYRRALDSSA
jgi:glycosyltransferase involved in cell wall biosynthesis